MIVCPNCNHQNPDGAVQCEACYTPLPAMMNCPNCGATVQTDASFCGQCGSNLRVVAPAGANSTYEPSASAQAGLPDLIQPDPLVPPEPLVVGSSPPIPVAAESELSAPVVASIESQPSVNEAAVVPPLVVESAGLGQPSPPIPGEPRTQLQQQAGRLLHIQTDTSLELPQTLSVIHIGKPNDRIPPDIDVSGFPDSEIVSRIHADIRLEADAFYIEDVGSSNGTYINNVPLPMGNRHRLRPGDRIALGKGDKVTFLFQLS